MVVAEHKHLAQQGAQLVELRLDWISRMPNMSRLVGDRPTPVVITCRRPEDKGRWKFTEEQRITILREAIVAGVEYVDLEVDIADKIPRYGDTKRIVSYHNFEETPAEIYDIHEKLCQGDPDIVKIVTMANTPADNVRMLELVESAEVPTVGFCMGDIGVVSRVLCGRYGAPFTYASFSRERTMAPGQIAHKDMRHMFRFNHINRETELYGVLGDPVGHSMSPLIHNIAFQKLGMNAVYLPVRVPSDGFVDSLKRYDWLGFQGYSVTIPHKETAMALADQVDSVTGDSGAANTLVKEDIAWHATNTDLDAAMDSLQILLDSGTGGTLESKQVLILGAGGVARAIGLGVIRAGGIVTIANRNHERAVKLADELGCQQATWENRGSVFAEIVINCTPVGMYPNMDETPFQVTWLRDNAMVFDTIYNPENTLLIKQARDRGCATISGLEMFVRQAARQFELFTGRDAPIDVMRDAARFGISGRNQ